jgi:hypothetical protein
MLDYLLLLVAFARAVVSRRAARSSAVVPHGRPPSCRAGSREPRAAPAARCPDAPHPEAAAAAPGRYGLLDPGPAALAALEPPPGRRPAGIPTPCARRPAGWGPGGPFSLVSVARAEGLEPPSNGFGDRLRPLQMVPQFVTAPGDRPGVPRGARRKRGASQVLGSSESSSVHRSTDLVCSLAGRDDGDPRRVTMLGCGHLNAAGSHGQPPAAARHRAAARLAYEWGRGRRGQCGAREGGA